MREDVSGEVRERTISIICEWWQQVGEGTESDNYLDRATIYEQLQNEGVEVHEDALNRLLVELAQDNNIKLISSISRTPLRASSSNHSQYSSFPLRSARAALEGAASRSSRIRLRASSARSSPVYQLATPWSLGPYASPSFPLRYRYQAFGAQEQPHVAGKVAYPLVDVCPDPERHDHHRGYA